MSKSRALFAPSATALAEVIVEHIVAKGPITVAEYMSLALSHPEHGYYIARPAIGADGDFITSPEISQMFGEMLGAWLVDVWLQLGKPLDIKLVELGPGKGTLSADIMRTMSMWPEVQAALSLHLIETSPRLRQIQFDALKKWHPVWYDRLEDVPAGPCFIIANEFFDALPIHQLEKTAKGWQERRIGWNPAEGKFFMTTADVSFDLNAVMPADFLAAPTGSIFETSPVSLSILDEICQRITDHNSAALIIDYGHETPGLGDTLQAVLRHRFADALEDPGSRDITAHVDFGTFRALAEGKVLVHGPVGQGAFLSALGIHTRAERLAQAGGEQAKEVALALHRLIDPQEMGTLFKVMGLTPLQQTLNIVGFGEPEKNPEEPA